MIFSPPHTVTPVASLDDNYAMINDNFRVLVSGLKGFQALPLLPQGSGATTLAAGSSIVFYNAIYALDVTDSPALVVNNFTVFVDSPGFNNDVVYRYPDGASLSAGQKKLFFITSTATTATSASGNDPVYQQPDGTLVSSPNSTTTGPYYPIAYQLVNLTNQDTVSHSYAIKYGLQALPKNQSIFR